jgi:hypothetical protein
MLEECMHGMEPAWCATCSKSDDTLAASASTASFHGGEQKQDVLNDVTDMLGLPRYVLRKGGGSSLPSEVFDAAARRVGVAVGSMPDICEAIVRTAGYEYSTAYDSRGTLSGGGSTVTLAGLQALRKSLRELLGLA